MTLPLFLLRALALTCLSTPFLAQVHKEASASPTAPTAAPESQAERLARERSELTALLGRLPDMSPEIRRNFAGMTERAKALGCVIVVPFAPGASALPERDAALLAEAVRGGPVRDLLRDPKTILFILAYNEPGAAGPAQKLATERAQAVLRIFREQGGVSNLMYGLGVGSGPRVFREAGNTAQVEVWTVVP